MKLPDVLLRAASFFAPPKPSDVRSLSVERSRERHSWAYLGALGRRLANDDPLLSQHGGGDIALWRDIMDDERCYSCFQQRRLAVVSRSWEVEPGAPDRRSKKAAQFVSEQIAKVGWDRICDRMLFGVWYGYAVAEAVYELTPDGLVGLARIDVPDRAWFGFDAEGGLRITDAMGVRDESVPDRKFWYYASGGDHDFVPYGIGLAHWLFWPVFFKRQGMPFWLRFLEKFGSPTVVGKVSSGQLDTEAGKAKAIEALRAVSGDSAIAVPDWLQLDLLEATRSGTGGYEMLIDRMDSAITRVILSQTMTTDDGSSRSQAQVHKDVRDEVVRSDADLLHESFNRSVAVWLTEFNFPGATPPRVYRIMDDPEDLNELAERDTVLKELGWHRTPESFSEVYGEGYEFKEPQRPPEDAPIDAEEMPEAFAAADVDAIDRLVTAMAGQGTEAVRAFVAPLQDKLKGMTNPEFLRIALLDHLEQMDPTAFAEALADPMLAVRAAAEAGIDVERLA